MSFFQSLLFFIMLLDMADSHPSYALPILKTLIKTKITNVIIKYRHKDNKAIGV